jgi:ribonuclease BN (tRNA processing enzyme)
MESDTEWWESTREGRAADTILGNSGVNSHAGPEYGSVRRQYRSARGTLVVIDCGTGGHLLARKLISGDAKRLRGSVLLSHTHWDHIQGIPFFDPLYVSGGEWDIYGPRGLHETLRDALAGQMQYLYFPVSLDDWGAKVRYHDMVEGTFSIDDIRISARYLNHPAVTLGYRLQVDGATLVYACDHEPYSRMLALGEGKITGQDLRHAEFMQGADLLIHDAQYTGQEYPEKIGWGHSPVEYVLKLAEYARVKRVALTHHDPRRDDDAIERMMASIRQASSVEAFAAFEGQTLELKTHPNRAAPPSGGELAEVSTGRTLASPTVLLGTAETSASAVICEAIAAESICARSLSSTDDAPIAIAKDSPALAILEHDPPRIDGIGLCRAIRRQAPEHRLPVIIVAEHEDQDAGAVAGVSDWLIRPFTAAHARTKIRTWLLRTAGKAIQTPTQGNEERRLPSLRVVHTATDLGHDRSRKLPRVSQGAADTIHLVISSEKAALLWMYGREIAPFDTQGFSNKVGEIIAHGASRAQRSSRSR